MAVNRPIRSPMHLSGGKLRQILTLVGSSMRAEPWVYFWAVTISGAFGALVVAISRLVGWATSYGVLPVLEGQASAGRRLTAIGLVFFGAATALGLSVAGRRIIAGLGNINLQAHHRRALANRYVRLPLTWHMQHPAGRLLAIAHSDVEAATGIFNPLPFALGVVVMIGVAAYALLSTDLWLALTALSIIPLVIAINLVFQRVMHPAITRAQQLRAEVSDIAHESFEALTLVKALGSADAETARFTHRAAELEAANIRVGKIRAVFDPIVDFLPHAGSLAVLVVGMLRLQSGAITDAGVIISAAFLLSLMAIPVRAFGWVIGEIPRSLVGWGRIAEVVDSPIGEQTTGNQRLTSTAQGIDLECANVQVSLSADGENYAAILTGLDFVVSPGQTVAVVGQTASGKSTLLRTLMRLLPYSDGEIRLDGLEQRSIANDDYTAQVALVTQQSFVFEDSVRANLTVGIDPAHLPDDQALWQSLERAAIADFIRDLPGKLDAPLGERGANLSGGQRQRIAIARALLRQPRLLMLDDATSAVDPPVEQQILANLSDTRHSAITPTVIVVAYRLSSILLADSIAVMHDGKIIAHGSHSELLATCEPYQQVVTAYANDAALREVGTDEG